MADTADRLLQVLEHIQQTNTVLADSLQQLVTRQEAEHQAFLEALQRLDTSLQTNTQALIQGQVESQAQGRTLGEMLVQLGETLARTEQMTAGVLSRLDAGAEQ